MLPNAAAPSAEAEQFLASVAQLLPEKMTAEQTAIWAEIVELVNDPAMIEATRRQLAPFAGRERTENEATSGRHIPELLERAQTALDVGLAPGSPEVQALVDEWITTFAAMLERPPGPDVELWLIEHAAELMPEPIERFWALMARLNGWEQRHSYAPAQRLLLDGLRRRHIPKHFVNVH